MFVVNKKIKPSARSTDLFILEAKRTSLVRKFSFSKLSELSF